MILGINSTFGFLWYLCRLYQDFGSVPSHLPSVLNLEMGEGMGGEKGAQVLSKTH